MTEELQKKAEDFIIERYKIAECYREDNAETREYMRMDVHSQYEEEYKLYLDATKELEKENAELKEKLKPENCIEYLARGGYVKFLCENGNEHDQLTKAKEIIKAYMLYCKGETQKYKEAEKQAEQFLKEE